MSRACSTKGEKRNAYRILAGKTRKENTRKKKRWVGGLQKWMG
jgi:hypothetical protein